MNAKIALKELRELHEMQIETGNTQSARAIAMAVARLEKPTRKTSALVALNAAAGEALEFFEVCDDEDALKLARKLRAARKKAKRMGY